MLAPQLRGRIVADPLGPAGVRADPGRNTCQPEVNPVEKSASGKLDDPKSPSAREPLIKSKISECFHSERSEESPEC